MTPQMVSPAYQPKFHMPVIGPPPAGTDPDTYYRGLAANTTVQVIPDANLAFKISLSNALHSQLFAMCGGLVSFIPAGNRLPTSTAEISPGAGSIVLQTWALDVDKLKKVLPPGVPPMTLVLYLNVKPDTVRSALESTVRTLPEVVLQGAWNFPSSSADRTALEDNYLNRLLRGETAVFVPGGTPIGDAGLSNPDDISSNVEFRLRFIDGGGNDLFPLLHLRAMPTYGGPQWSGHPLVNALSSIPIPVNIYLQFEVWNQSRGMFETLASNVAVDLMDYDPVTQNDILMTQQTDSQGRVHFSSSDLQAMAGEAPDIFFRIQTNGMSHAGQILPNEWSTKGWTAADDSPGYYEDFMGTQLGDARSPIVFRIGVDFHLRLVYLHEPTRVNRVAPKGITVYFHYNNLARAPVDFNLRTDSNGELHGVVFDIVPKDMYFNVLFEIEDDTIHLRKASVSMDPLVEPPGVLGDDYKLYLVNDRTSIGTQNTPEVFRCSTNERNVAIYFLKLLYELNDFLYHITGHSWTGFTDLTFYRTAAFGVAYSWPVGHVNIPPADHWNRGTIIHEISHQIMWKEVNYTTLGIAYEFITRDLRGYHRANLLSNTEHAFIEGWAEFIGSVFEGTRSPPYNVNNLTDIDGNPVPGGLGPPPNNRGESVEGAFANGLWAVFKNIVAVSSSMPLVPESTNGDITINAQWILDTSVQQRFQSIIWEPLRDLRSMSNPTSTAMLGQILLRNSQDVMLQNAIRAQLQLYNMAI